MTATIQKWGNSLALRIPSVIAREMQVENGATVDLKLESGTLSIRSAQPKYRLEELVKVIRPENRHDEVDWGIPVGREL